MDATQLGLAIAAKRNAEEYGRWACTRFGARAVDLQDAGYPAVWSRTTARDQHLQIGPTDARWLGDPADAFPFYPHQMPPGCSMPAANQPAVVAVVPSNATGAGYTIGTLRCYLRDRRLQQPVRWRATHIATDTAGLIDQIFPIAGRFLCGGPGASVQHPDPVVQARARTALRDTLVAATWTEPFDLLVLDNPFPLTGPAGQGLPLGFRGGNPRVRHHYLSHLQTAPTLLGLPGL